MKYIAIIYDNKPLDPEITKIFGEMNCEIEHKTKEEGIEVLRQIEEQDKLDD